MTSHPSWPLLTVAIVRHGGLNTTEGPAKTLHQNPLAMVVDISGWGTGFSTLWQPHLPVNVTKGQPAYVGLPGKWPLTWDVC